MLHPIMTLARITEFTATNAVVGAQKERREEAAQAVAKLKEAAGRLSAL
jgi:hypothetical protein